MGLIAHFQAIIDRKRSNKLLRKESAYAGMAPQAIFNKIYNEAAWGAGQDGHGGSGPGSHDPKIVDSYVEITLDLVEKLDISTIVDLGCGDFNIGSKIAPSCDQYLACDVSDVILQHNRSKFEFENVEFRQLDLTSDELPRGDLATVRQVLQHLDNSQVASFVQKLVKDKPYKYLLVTEHVPKSKNFRPNLNKIAGADIRTKLNSAVVLEAAPFDLPHKSKKVLLEVDQYAGRKATIQTVLYQL